MEQVSVGEALKHKYPEWIDLVVSRSSSGQINAMPVGWSMIASSSPPLYAVAIGHRRFSAQLMHESQEFVIAVPSVALGPATHYCGTHSGRTGDKIAPAGLELIPASQVETPLIKGAVYNLECKLYKEIESGDHILFVGHVVAAHYDPDVGPRLMNFGNGLWACADLHPGSEFQT